MAKSLLFTLFGVGRIPEDLLRDLKREGLLLHDEGLVASLHYRKYRAPHLGATGRKSSSGWVALSKQRLVAKGHWETSVIPLTHPKAASLDYGLHRENCFRFAYEASDFYADRRGRIEHRLHTPVAARLVERLDRQLQR